MSAYNYGHGSSLVSIGYQLGSWTYKLSAVDPLAERNFRNERIQIWGHLALSNPNIALVQRTSAREEASEITHGRGLNPCCDRGPRGVAKDRCH
jgi:hypothetical protein